MDKHKLDEALDLPEPETEDEIQKVPNTVRRELTEEQIAKAHRMAMRLMNMEKHPQIMGPALCLVYARQLYNIALYALNRNLEEEGVKQEEGVLAVLTDSMNELAMKAFRRDKLVEGLQKIAVPLAIAEMRREEQEMGNGTSRAQDQTALPDAPRDDFVQGFRLGP